MAIQQQLDTAAEQQRMEMERLLGKSKKDAKIKKIPPPDKDDEHEF